MKKILLIALATMMMVPAGFAKKTTDPYHEKVKSLFFADGSMQDTKDQIAASFTQKMENGEMDKKIAKKLKKYISGEFIDDMIGIYEEALRGGNVTMDEIDDVIAYTQADSTKLISSKATVLVERLQNGDSTALAAVQLLIANLTQIVQGEEVAPLSINATPEYEKAFHAYYTASGTNVMMESYMQNIFGGIFQSLGLETNNDEAQQLLEPMKNYMVDNMEAAVMGMMDGIYSTDELNYYTRHMATPSYQHYVQAMSKADLSKLLTKLFSVMGVKM